MNTIKNYSNRNTYATIVFLLQGNESQVSAARTLNVIIIKNELRYETGTKFIYLINILSKIKIIKTEEKRKEHKQYINRDNYKLFTAKILI